jgi:hypothetical protein
MGAYSLRAELRERPHDTVSSFPSDSDLQIVIGDESGGRPEDPTLRACESFVNGEERLKRWDRVRHTTLGRTLHACCGRDFAMNHHQKDPCSRRRQGAKANATE